VIMCGHFPEGVETFEQDTVVADESQGEWYLRQMLGSANMSGGPLFHVLAGNLSHQIEHHLFPDLPSNRYAEIAPEVQQVFERYGLTYHVAPMPQQLASAWHKVFRLSRPNPAGRATSQPDREQALVDTSAEGPHPRPQQAPFMDGGLVDAPGGLWEEPGTRPHSTTYAQRSAGD
jgi:fatty acid desaturase